MQNVDFELDGEYVELNQLLKLVGICDSGGAGKAIVAAGDVSVDGKQELRKTAGRRPRPARGPRAGLTTSDTLPGSRPP